jgi:hypothetical protein
MDGWMNGWKRVVWGSIVVAVVQSTLLMKERKKNRNAERSK